MSKMSKEEAAKLVAESAIMAPVVECLASGNFVAVDEPLAEGETVVGQATDLEKALYTVSDKIADEHNAMVDEACEGSKVSLIAYINLYHKIQIYKVIKSFFWLSINDRIPEAKKSSDIGIRDGYLIVIYEKRCTPCKNGKSLKVP